MNYFLAVILSSTVLFFSSLSHAAVSTPLTLVLQNHQFEPKSLTIAAQQKVTLIIKNRDASVEEFESKDMQIEKIVPAKGQVKVVLGPLEPGQYNFVGEYHEETAKGSITVK